MKEEIKEIVSRLGNKVAPKVKQGMEEALNVIILERRIDERLKDAKDLNFLDDDQVIEMVKTNLSSQIPYMRGGDLESKYQRRQMKAYSKLLHIYEWMKDGMMVKQEIHRHKKGGQLENCGSSLQVKEYAGRLAVTIGADGKERVEEQRGLVVRNLFCPQCNVIVQRKDTETEVISEIRDKESGEYLDAMKRIVAWASRKIYVIAWRAEDLESRPIALTKMFPDFGGGGGGESSEFMKVLLEQRGRQPENQPTQDTSNATGGNQNV